MKAEGKAGPTNDVYSRDSFFRNGGRKRSSRSFAGDMNSNMGSLKSRFGDVKYSGGSMLWLCLFQTSQLVYITDCSDDSEYRLHPQAWPLPGSAGRPQLQSPAGPPELPCRGSTRQLPSAPSPEEHRRFPTHEANASTLPNSLPTGFPSPR